MDSQAPVPSSEVPLTPEVAPLPEVAPTPEAVVAPAPELITSVPGMEAPVAAVAPVESGSVVTSEKVGIPVEATPEMIAVQAKREADVAIATAAAESVAATSAVNQEKPLAPLGPNAIEVPAFIANPEAALAAPAAPEVTPVADVTTEAATTEAPQG